jgi:alpha-ketoglutarate-dependent dioxygenase FTO
LQGKDCNVQINAPPLAIPLPDNACYYLLDEFNHHHQHSVLAGKSQRYASTHRVARVDGHTYGSIKSKCVQAINGSGYSGKQIRSEQLAICDLEFEWIRMFYIQGEKHKNKNLYWCEKFVELLSIWKQLELKTLKTIEVLEDAVLLSQSSDKPDSKKELKKLNKRKKRIISIDKTSFTEMIDGLQNKYDKRVGWIKRANDDIFKSEPLDCRPIKIPFDATPHPDSSAAQINLKETINKLGLLKARYDQLNLDMEFETERKRSMTETTSQEPKSKKIKK